MRPVSLYEKLLELYINDEEPDFQTLKRCVINYLHRKIGEKKVKRIINDALGKHDIKNDVLKLRARNNLSNHIDSIVESRIRESIKCSTGFDIDALDELKFQSIIKLVLLSFGYKILYIPNLYTDSINFIVHRDEVKIAVLSVKSAAGFKVGPRIIEQVRVVANYYNCEQAIVFSNAYFDEQAIRKSNNIGVILLDRDKLIPLVESYIKNRQEEEKEYILSFEEAQKSDIYLEGEMKFPKTKVQVVYIKYSLDNQKTILTFEGKLLNTGKNPCEKIKMNIKVFNREGDISFDKVFAIDKGRLNSKEEIDFKFSFDKVEQFDWLDLCRYQLKLDYKNTSKI